MLMPRRSHARSLARSAGLVALAVGKLRVILHCHDGDRLSEELNYEADVLFGDVLPASNRIENRNDSLSGENQTLKVLREVDSKLFLNSSCYCQLLQLPSGLRTHI